MLKNETLRRDADAIIRASLNAVLPDEAVRRALKNFRPQGGRVLLVAAGKAAWQMAHAAVKFLGRVDGGVVVTKYGHVKGTIPDVDCCEAGHPVPDENGFAATRKALELVQGLTAEDTVLFLLSGGGSALFEKPLIPGAELQQITGQLLASGADIVEMNTIRKRLSGVKGGRFAQNCAPAQVFSRYEPFQPPLWAARMTALARNRQGVPLWAWKPTAPETASPSLTRSVISMRPMRWTLSR